MAKKKNGNPLDDLAALTASSTTEAKSTKSKKGIILNTDVEVEDGVKLSSLITDWLEAQRQTKDAKALMDILAERIAPTATELWIKACQTSGEVQTSAKLDAISIAWKTGSQMFSRGSLVPSAIEEAIGEDDYETYFVEKQGPYQLAEEAMSDTEFLGDLVKLLQKHKKGEYLTRTKTAQPRDALYNLRIEDPKKYAKIETKLKEDAGVKDQKPTFAAR